GCCYRATRLLWEQIRCLRAELDHWSKLHGRKCRLQGFSTHYNFSFPDARKSKSRNATKLAFLLAHILPVPVLLLAANRQSSAVGVRPRKTRVEVTVDFTPDPALMLATCAFVAGVVRTVLNWKDFGLRQLSRHGVPRPTPFQHIAAVFNGDARSLLDFPKHPEVYDDVGHAIDWGRRRMRRWSRSRYEKVIHRVLAHEAMRIGQKRYRAERMNGWYQVDFRE